MTTPSLPRDFPHTTPRPLPVWSKALGLRNALLSVVMGLIFFVGSILAFSGWKGSQVESHGEKVTATISTITRHSSSKYSVIVFTYPFGGQERRQSFRSYTDLHLVQGTTEPAFAFQPLGFGPVNAVLAVDAARSVQSARGLMILGIVYTCISLITWILIRRVTRMRKWLLENGTPVVGKVTLYSEWGWGRKRRRLQYEYPTPAGAQTGKMSVNYRIADQRGPVQVGDPLVIVYSPEEVEKSTVWGFLTG